jgi:hypothetical protein
MEKIAQVTDIAYERQTIGSPVVPQRVTTVRRVAVLIEQIKRPVTRPDVIPDHVFIHFSRGFREPFPVSLFSIEDESNVLRIPVFFGVAFVCQRAPC